MRDANEWPALVEQIEDATQIDEYDYYAAEREVDMLAFHCRHEDSEYVYDFNAWGEPDEVPIGWHCYQCGARRGSA